MTARTYNFPRKAADARPTPDDALDAGLSLRIMVGMSVTAFLVFGIGGWAATAQLAGAVIASGVVVVDTNIKKVQHPTGGVVGEIRVKNGSRVRSGDIVLRLDDIQTRASLGIVQSQLTELSGRRARLTAERDGDQSISFPEGFAERDKEARRVAVGEAKLFTSKQKLISNQKAQLRERIGQFEEDIKGLTAQLEAKSREQSLVRSELIRIEKLYESRLTPVTRLLAMQREEARIAGEHGVLISQIASRKGRITEIGLQLLNIDRTSQSEAQKELRDVEARVAELRERKIAAVDKLKRVDIRAPRSGVVHELTIHTVGGVVSAGEPIMLIVPNEDRLIIEARIKPADIDQVSLGQETKLRFSAFNLRTTPELTGRVVRVAADLSRDQNTSRDYYRLRVTVDETQLKKLGALVLLPGMPVEVFIQTEDRTALSYIFKPLTDQLERTFREE